MSADDLRGEKINNRNTGCRVCTDCTDCTDCMDCMDCMDCYKTENAKGARYLVFGVQLTAKQYNEVMAKLDWVHSTQDPQDLAMADHGCRPPVACTVRVIVERLPLKEESKS